MGTEYHMMPGKCSECGHRKPGYIIGKKSAGWKFIFEGRLFGDIFDVRDRIEGSLKEGWQIKDEGGHTICLDEFLKIVLKSQSAAGKRYDSELYRIDDYGFIFSRGR
jgi:hypothetical protein